MKTKIVIVEAMPRHHRTSHIAAGASTLATAGRYPSNGAQRYAMSDTQARIEVAAGEGWVRIVSTKPSPAAIEMLEPVSDLDWL